MTGVRDWVLGALDLRAAADAVRAATWLQLRIARRDIEMFSIVATMPFISVVALAVMTQVGRLDLASHALVTATLLTSMQAALFVAGEVLVSDRDHERLLLHVVSPAPYVATLLTRVFLVALLSLLGFAEAWLLSALIFHRIVLPQDPFVLALSLMLSAVGVTGLGAAIAAILCLGRSARTLQSAIMGPLLLFGGVMAPVGLLPVWVQWLARPLFLSWAGDLLRDALSAPKTTHEAARLLVLCMTSAVSLAIGSVILARMLNRLRGDGRLSLI